ncbi:CD209 antigen-like protein E [Sardina pilchardus]|uniref:CD209 antigen-like protein E n=1 Tax=Sardina pilchardus TaxID=27697 RepID=UPI002E147E42
MDMDHIYGNVCADNTESHRASSSQSTLKATTKALILLLVIGVTLLLGVAVLCTLTHKHVSRLSDEQKTFALDAPYNKIADNLTAECSCRACPEGWKHHRGKCYLFSSSEMNWEGSRDHCITLGGHLVIVNDQEEQHFLAAQLKGVPHWIGLNDVEGQWRWVDNKSLSDTGVVFWFNRSHLNETDEPDNRKEDPLGENCATISLHTGGWQDYSCKNNNTFICETLASS